MEGRPDVWLIGSPAYNFKKPVNSVSELYPLPVYMSLQPESSREIVQWLSKSLLSWWREILEQRLSKTLLSWWRESVPEEEESDSATIAESQE